MPIQADGLTPKAVNLTEVAAPSGVVGQDIIYGDSTAHRVKMNNNNVGADVVVGANTTDTLTNKTLTAPISDKLVLTASAPTVSAGQVGLGSGTATTATAGSNGAVPAQVAGYLVINIGGTNVKVPYFNS